MKFAGFLAAGLVALSVFAAPLAASAVTVTNVSNAPTSWALADAATSDSLSLPGTWEGTAPAIRQGNLSGVYRSTFDNQGVGTDNSAYIGKSYWAIGPGNGTTSATLKFAAEATGLNFLWGSVDGHNKVTFFSKGTLVATVTAATLAGEVGGLGASWVSISGFRFDKVVFNATGNAFEFSNITAAQVPLPAPALLLIAALGSLGAMRAMRRRV